MCGGAFNGLEKIILARGRSASIGFSAKVLAPEDRKLMIDIATGDVEDREPEPSLAGKDPATVSLACLPLRCPVLLPIPLPEPIPHQQVMPQFEFS